PSPQGSAGRPGRRPLTAAPGGTATAPTPGRTRVHDVPASSSVAVSSVASASSPEVEVSDVSGADDVWVLVVEEGEAPSSTVKSTVPLIGWPSEETIRQLTS